MKGLRFGRLSHVRSLVLLGLIIIAVLDLKLLSRAADVWALAWGGIPNHEHLN